jgi:glycerol kinase
MQMLADLSGVDVLRPAQIESTGIGAALLAARGCGMHAGAHDVERAWQLDLRVTPSDEAAAHRDAARARFGTLVAAARELARATASEPAAV